MLKKINVSIMQGVAMAFIRHDLPAGSSFLPSFSPPAPVPRWVVSAAVSPDEGARARMLRERQRERQRTPGTTLAAVWVDIQGWLIYGAGESVSLLWVFDRTGQTGLLAASSPPTLLVTSFYHCTITDSPSTATLSPSLNSDIVLNEVGKHEVISLSALRITSRNFVNAFHLHLS